MGDVELTNGPALTNGRRIVRALAVFLFAAGLALSGARVVGTRFEPVLFIPAGLAVLVGWLVYSRHVIMRVGAQVAAFIVSGLAIAYASGGTAKSFMRGLLDGPHQIITTAWPSPRFPTILVAIGALVFVAAAISVDLAMRMRWRALPIAPMVVAMAVLIAGGAPDGPQWQPLVCAAASGFLLLWIGLDDRVASIRSGVPVAISAALAVLVVSLSVGVDISERANPRHAEAPNNQLTLVDPLSDVYSQQHASPAVEVYSVQSPSLPNLRLWRTAAVDVYNGESWSVSGRLIPVGNRLADPTGAPRTVVKVATDRTDTGVWPVPGLLLRSTTPVEAGRERRVISIIGDQRPVQTVFTVEPLATFDPQTAGDLPIFQPTDLEASYAPLARQYAPDGTRAEQVAALAKKLHDDYTLNPTVPGGVQQKVIDTFLRNSNVGTEEQFLTGFVLLARSIGVDARIATGYKLESSAKNATIRTNNAWAWPEVRAANGWASVDDLLPDPTTAIRPPASTGQADTPPAPPPVELPKVEQADPNDPAEAPQPDASSTGWSGLRVWALRGGVFTGLLLWPLVVFAVVVSWKKLRRRKGLKAPDPARRVRTAWTLATDALVDAGASLQTSHTNAELVEAGVKTQPSAGPPLGRLQRHADAVTFATAECDLKRATDAVDQLRLVEASIRNSSSRWWRWKWWLSTRSLRRRTQSPLR